MKCPLVKPYPSLQAPWSLHFDRDGTEDIGIIRDANGHDLATSGHFWLPEENDPFPATLHALRVMTAAPELKEALGKLLVCLINRQGTPGYHFTESEQEASQAALKALFKAGEQ